MPNILTYAPFLDLSTVTLPNWAVNDWWNAPDRYIQPADGTPRIHAQIVVQEEGSDDLNITEHPVSQGAVIHDHAFKRPAELSVRMGWSSAATSGTDGLRAVYSQILTLQATRTPFAIATGKRLYQNMLVASLRTMTDARMEFSFMADISFREVILVNTSIVVVGNLYNSNTVISPDIHTATVPSGQTQAIPANLELSDAEIADLRRLYNVPQPMTPTAG